MDRIAVPRSAVGLGGLKELVWEDRGKFIYFTIKYIY